MISAKVKGLDDLHRKFRALEQVAQGKILNKAAFAGGIVIEGKTKGNIQADNLIDTGFLINSVSTSTLDESTYGASKSAAKSANPSAQVFAEYRHQKQGRAVVMVGAEYAAYLHEGTSRIAPHPFLLNAATDGARDAAEAAGKVFREEVRKAVR